MPGTIHDSSALATRSMWKADGIVQLSDEIELTVIIQVMKKISNEIKRM